MRSAHRPPPENGALCFGLAPLEPPFGPPDCVHMVIGPAGEQRMQGRWLAGPLPMPLASSRDWVPFKTGSAPLASSSASPCRSWHSTTSGRASLAQCKRQRIATTPFGRALSALLVSVSGGLPALAIEILWPGEIPP
jgi:hypothetical protein